MPGLIEEIKQTKPFKHKAEEVYLNLQRTAEALSWAMSDTLKPYELTPVQYNVLRILRGAGEVGIKCGEISERLVTKDSDVTRLLDRLETRRMVERRRDRQDRRIINAFITEKGLSLLAELDEPISASSREMFAELSARQLAELNDLLVLARGQNP